MQLKPYHVYTVGGHHVGVIGIDIKGKTELSSSPSPGTYLLDEVTTAQKFIDELHGKGINKIILLSHVGLSKDKAIAGQLRGVDVIVGGDSHSLMGDAGVLAKAPGAAPVGEYPSQTADADGKTVCIVQAWHYSNVVGELEVNFDANGDVLSCTGRPIIPLAESSTWVNALSRTPLSDVEQAGVMAALPAGAAVYAEKSDAKAWIDTNVAQIATMKQERIATFERKFCLARDPGSSRSSTICTVCDTYHRGGGACQLVAKAFLMGEKSAHIAIQNGGGCRKDLPNGNYSVGQAYEMLPFSNTMVTLEMTGEQVRDVLEDALEYFIIGGSTGAYPYAAGLRYHVDASKAKGSRISNLEVNPRLGSCTWSPIDPAFTYVVVTNNYIAGGKDGYATFGAVPADKVVNTFTNYAQGFIDYLRTMHTAIMPLHPEEYSTQGYINKMGCGHSTNGECVVGFSCGVSAAAVTPCEDDRLFFSEYAEGSSNNKYLEIFNGGVCTANLSEYAFPNANNGADVDGKPDYWNTFPAGAVLKPGAVYIIAHSLADTSIRVKANHTHQYLSNGDDGFCLVKGNASAYQIIDCIGDFNKTDPGDAWAVCGIATATKDRTLVRKAMVTRGNGGNWAESAGTSTGDCEWNVLAIDEWSYLGSHHAPPAPKMSAISTICTASIKVLHINDHHSYIEGDKFKMNTSAVLTGIGEVEIRYGGFPRIATVMQQHSDDSTLKLHAGDAITGTLWYTIFKGAADAAMMGHVCFDAFALGNHEFDDGDAALSDFLTELAGTGCDTQVRACAGSR